MRSRHIISRDLIYLHIRPGRRVIYFSLANTCERDGLTLAMATSSRMMWKAVIAGLASTKIHYNPLVHSESVNSSLVAAKSVPSLTTSPR